MINKPTLQEVTTCLNVINWAIDDLDIGASDSVTTLYAVLSANERGWRVARGKDVMSSHLAAVIQAQEHDTKKPDNRVNYLIDYIFHD